jgi:nucleotide-binding universal stress UspA family protein
MATFEHVLVPTDGSKAARRAAEHAIDLVSDTGGEIVALYVVDMGDADFVAVPSDIAQTKARIQKKGEELVGKVREMATEAGVECETAVVTGIADEEIVDYAESHGIDLIVLGKHGKRDPDKPIVGNTARRVVQQSSIPVHTV